MDFYSRFLFKLFGIIIYLTFINITMRKVYYFFLASLVMTGLESCSTQSQGERQALSSQAVTSGKVATQQEKAQKKETPCVSIWDKISVRENPGSEGKWLTSLSIGESVIYLNESKTDSANDNHLYFKIRLNDGKEGWSRTDFLVPEARPAVFTQETNLYKRPDLLTKSDKLFSKMDIIAVMETQDDWLKIKGKRTSGKWIEEGWIKAENISLEAVDIATAKFTKAALEEKDEENRLAALEEIVNNGDLATSVFMPELYGMAHPKETEKTEEELAEEAEYNHEMISEYLPASDSLQ